MSLNVPLPPGTAMSSVALGANSTLLLGSNVHISEEGSATGRSTIVNAGAGTTSTTQTGVVLASDIWSVGDVFLATSTSISGSVTTAGTVTEQTGVTVQGTVSQHQPLVPTPTTLTVAFPSSATGVTLQPGQTGSISPGAYAGVTVNSRATLTLSSGTYYIDTLDVEPQGVVSLTGAGPFVINVRTSFMAKGQLSLPLASPAPTLVVVDAGTSDVFLQAEFDGTLIAPNANLTLAAIGTSSYHGAFFGKSVTLQAGVTMVHRSSGTGTVAPIAECVIAQADGSYQAVFGYLSSALLGNVTIPLGSNNAFDPGPASRGQPQVFLPGRQRAQFVVPFNGNALSWVLDGVSTTASLALPQCTPACVQNLVDPTKPKITTVLPTAAPPLSVDESIVMRDSFRWIDTLPVPEKFADGTPRLYYGLIYLDSRQTLQAMDLLRINYSNIPLFEQEMQAFEQQGIVAQFFHPHDGAGQFAYALLPGAIYNAIRTAALNPTTPFEMLRALPIRPIPATDEGLAPQSSCGLQPIAQCVAQASNGSLRAVFSYNNPSGGPVTIPIGSDNALTGGPAGTSPPEAFASGQHTAIFAVPMAAGATIRWTLNGQTATETSQTPRCSAAIVAQIGVDQYKPFPAPATPRCRFATPAEAQFPNSQLPPAARANTCTSVSYQYAGTLGFKWRGVDSDAQDTAGQAADAAFALVSQNPPATMSSTSGQDQVVRSAWWGHILRAVVQTVVSVVQTTIDDTRRGLTGVAGFFVGSVQATVEIDLHNTDPGFDPTEIEKQAWGAGYGNPISMQGVQAQATSSFFLSVDDLDNTNQARVNVLKHLGNFVGNTRLCLKLENGAGKVVSGLLTDILCPSRVNPATGIQKLAISDAGLNVVAQVTDAQHYMAQAGGTNNPLSQAEISRGTIPNLIGLVNMNRAFTPCLGFSWDTDLELLVVAIGVAATPHLDPIAEADIRAVSGYSEDIIRKATTTLADAPAAMAGIANQLTGTAFAVLAAQAQAAVANALVLLQAAQAQSAILTQDADDLVRLTATAARYAADNDPRVSAATALVQQAVAELARQVPITQAAVQSAATAATAASSAVAALLTALQGAQASLQNQILPILQPIADSLVHTVGGLAVAINSLATTVALKVQHVVDLGVTNLTLLAASTTVGEALDFLAGGDIIMPAAHGDSSNLTSRGTPTHEYGHFVLCSLLDRASPSQFATAYNEAAASGLISQQSPGAIGAVMNESFADLISSQVAGGTSYAAPKVNSFASQAMTYCDATATRCIEDDLVNNGNDSMSFTLEVERNVELYTDAFDGRLAAGDGPMNGNVWTKPMGGLIHLAPFPGISSGDEVVTLMSSLNPNSAFKGSRFQSWISHAMNHGTLLREDNMFGGLSDTMVDEKYNWCARCEVFSNHTVDTSVVPPPGAPFPSVCPAQWVGQRPTFSLDGGVTTLSLDCVFEHDDGICPPTTTANATTQVCDPNCPIGNQHFDSFGLACVPNIVP